MTTPMSAPISRRAVLKAGGAAAAGVALAGCDGIVSLVTEDMPEQFGVADQARIDSAVHLLNRVGFGPRPGDLDEVKAMGEKAWIERQLAPETIDDWRGEFRANQVDSTFAGADEAYNFTQRTLRREIVRHTILKATYSERQLLELMVRFWTDHFNIDLAKGDCVYLKPTDDRRIRQQALGSFRELVKGSATSAAMLVYLDGNANTKARPEDVPNENYARELLELHTLGVDGGYTQQDVYEVARCLTGWRVQLKGFRRGRVRFDSKLHDDGAKLVLGTKIPSGGGAEDLERVLDIVCSHPSTARYVSTKLVQRLVGDPAPEAVVTAAAEAFRTSDGQIKDVLRAILYHPEFGAHKGTLLKRPFRFVVSALRVSGADSHARNEITSALDRMGQAPFSYPTPDGYPIEPAPWVGTLLWRWNLALNLGFGRLGKTQVPLDELAKGLGHDRRSLPASTLFAHAIGRQPSEAEREALALLATDDARAKLACVIASPAFQRY